MYKVCLITAPNPEVARDLARRLLEARLVACVNLVPSITSLYWWEGQIQEDGEILMVLKTIDGHVDSIVELVRAHHPYTVPEVIALPIERGHPAYLDWIKESCG